MQFSKDAYPSTIVDAARDLRMRTKAGVGNNAFVLVADPNIPTKERPFTIITIDGRFSAYVCWHGHLAWLMRLYNIFPEMSVNTRMTKYRSRYDFRVQVMNDERIVPDGLCTCKQDDIEAALDGKLADGTDEKLKKERWDNVLRNAEA